MELPRRPLLIFDGDCGFCRRWIERWRAHTGERVEYEPYQEAAGRFPEIPVDCFQGAVQLVEPDGRVCGGAEAVFRALSFAPGRGAAYWVYRHMPGAAGVSEACYRFVARHRPGLSSLTLALWGPDVRPPTYRLTRGLFLRLLGLIYLIAFASLGVQVVGLVGEEGILPVSDLLQAARARFGSDAAWLYPTVCWWMGSSDTALRGICATGAALAGLLIAGLAPGPILAALWVLYLSMVTAGQTFLSFQWDILLLETGLLAVLVAPWRLWPAVAGGREPGAAGIFLLRWLLFRLMFLSGVVKLASGDALWSELRALEVHYETQPLPTWTSWYVHQLPGWAHRASCFLMFVVELGVAFLIFAPRRLRFAACAAFVGFQLLIAATGNYTFFNWLTIVLCVPLLDDAALRRVFPRRVQERLDAAGPRRMAPWWRRGVMAVIAMALVVLSLTMAYGRFYGYDDVPDWAKRVLIRVQPYHLANSYGLFAVMTQRRPEIIIEGSTDGREWKAYEFRWKPGDMMRRPGFVAPHQPRLDWQMWFAALSRFERTRWFGSFCVRLLEGSPEALALLETNPFGNSPPRYVRATVYEYHFTDVKTRRETGAWWRRERVGMYCGPLALNR